MAIKVIICLVLGYIFGCFQTGYFYGKLFKGIDVRNYGSGNAGTTNTLRTLGKPGRLYCLSWGCPEGSICRLDCEISAVPGTGDVTKILETVTALGVVLGHNYPFYMHFKGGKGIAATGGFMFALDVRIALIAAIVFAVVFFTTRYVSVGSLTITALFPILMLIFYPGQWVVFGLSLIFTALAWWRHRANIKRLMNGTENKFEKKKK